MKKVLAVLILLFVFCTSMGIFTACEGGELPHQHEYSEIYKKDNTYHWYECSCGEDKGKEQHVFTDDVCVCGYEKIIEHVHDYSETYSYNSESHWYECDCGEKKGEALHQLVDNRCVCGYEKIVEHVHAFVKKIVKNTYKASSVTCTEKAKYYLSCECGEKGTETFEVGEPLEHAYGDWQSNNDGTHSKICANDNKHKITEKCSGGTATEENRPICSVCSSEYGAVLGHVHSFTEKNPTDKFLVSEATCLKKAVYNKSCSCGEEGEATFEYGELDSHKINVVTQIILGTEEESVQGSYCRLIIGICETCGLSASEYDREHDYVEEIIEPTCTEQGYTIETCSKCGHELEKTDITPALDHDIEESTRPYDDNPSHDECTYGYYTFEKCTRQCCDYETEAIFVEPTGHHSNSWKVTTAPTKSNEGELTGDCSACGKTDATRKLPILGEAYENVLDNENRPEGKSNYDNYTFSIIVDGQTITFGVLIGHVCGEEIIVGGSFINNYTTERYPAIKLFMNAEDVSCCEYTNAYFECEACNEIIMISIMKTHSYNGVSIDEENSYPSNTEGLVKLGNQPANCLGEGGGYFVCDTCEDPIYVKVQGSHTGKTNIHNHDTYITFDCTTCGKEDIIEPIE